MKLPSFLSLSASVFMMIGATFSANAEPDALQQNTQKKVANVEVKIVSRRNAQFSITNNTREPIRLDSGLPDELLPADGNVEYMQKGQWKVIGWGHDLAGQEFRLAPGKTATFYLPVFDYLKKGMLVRARVDSYISKPFIW